MRTPFFCALKGLFVFSALFISVSLFGQTTLARWDGQSLTPVMAANVSGQAVSGDYADLYDNAGEVPSMFIIGNYGTPPNTSYLDFTIQPNASFRFSLTNVSFQISGMDGAITYALRSSVDGFATDIATGTATANDYPYVTYDARSHNLGSSFTNLGSPVTFRLVKTSDGDMVHTFDIRISGTASPTVLPLHFTSFTAVKQSSSILLRLQTANEENTSHFEIERSSDGLLFSTIGRLPAQSSAISHYSFTDAQPAEGANYYRIKQADRDGKFAYSHIVLVSYGDEAGLLLTPNPVKKQLRIVRTDAGLRQDGILTIHSISGNVVKSIHLKPGVTSNNLDLSQFASGVYFVKYTVGGKTITQKFIKE